MKIRKVNIISGSTGIIYSIWRDSEGEYMDCMEWINKKGEAYAEVERENRFDNLFLIELTPPLKPRASAEDPRQPDFLKKLFG